MTNCPSCNCEVPAGFRWCQICHTNVINPKIGRLSSPAKRLGAYILDWFIFVAVAYFASPIGGVKIVERIIGEEMLFLTFLLFIVYIIWVGILFVKGTTPGKKLCGIKVIYEDGRRAGFFTMFARESLGKFVSGMILLLGFLWILFDRDRQGWHDKLFSTYVVEVGY